MNLSKSGAASIVGFAMCLIALAPAARADDASWLDQKPLSNWNAQGMDLPPAPPPDSTIDARFTQRERMAETAEDEALAAAGWRLYTAYQGGWGIKIVLATSSYDGMGRPWGYQAFVFADGTLAGIVSPDLMNSRFDGALTRAQFFGPDNIVAEFLRYTPTDALCCPSATSTVAYRVDRSDAGPVLVPVSVSTQPTTR